nr:hypothetical protein [Thiothrix subterranea]
MKQVKVLFVCMGNICRSPTAQGVFERLVQSQGLADRILIDSAGTHAYHIGNPPINVHRPPQKIVDWTYRGSGREK